MPPRRKLLGVRILPLVPDLEELRSVPFLEFGLVMGAVEELVVRLKEEGADGI